MPAYRPFIFASFTFATSLATLVGSSSLAFADAGPKTSAHAHGKTDSVAAPVAKRHRTNVESISITTTVSDAPAKKDAALPAAATKKAPKLNAHVKHGHVVSPQKDTKVAKESKKETTVAIELAPLPAPDSKNAPLKNVVDAGGKKKIARHAEVAAEVAPKHVGRADHAVEPESTPKIEATLDPTIHFVPMSATTMAPMEATIETSNVKSGKVTTTVTASTSNVAVGAKKDAAVSSKKKDAKSCLHSQIDILRGVEEEKLALTKCDGSVAPGAVERLSILVRPSSASRPIASLTELSKIKGPELSPGVKKIDPLLVSHLETVVDHFTKPSEHAKVFVISGYRPGAAGSFHQSGKALDFRIDGVKNEELVAFCKSLPDTGCGYYPNSSFVHMDIRTPNTGHVSWIDSSGPGEEPRYVSAWPPPAEPMKHDRSEAKSALNQIDKEMPPTASDEHPTDPEAISDMNQAPPADILTTGDN